MRVLVTGHVGFIGSHFVKHLLRLDEKVEVVGFNRHSHMDYLKRFDDLFGMVARGRLHHVFGDLADPCAVSGLCEGIDVVVNFAAKTHVDCSLKDRQPFIASNIIGADNLMEDATRYKVKRYVQVSTDEVYGEILTGTYKEDAPLCPRNPYAWSKACADLNAIQRHRTYGFPCIVTRCENNFGPWQHRQKVLPTFARCAMRDEPLPVYGDGMHVRCWLHVEEHCRAIWHLVTRSMDIGARLYEKEGDAPPEGNKFLGEVFHIAGEDEMTNLDLMAVVLNALDKPGNMYRFVPDHDIRPGHDRRYALDCSKLKATGFTIKQDVRALLTDTVRWYAEHPEWTR